MKIFREIFGRICALWGLILTVGGLLATFPFYLPCYVMKEPYAARWHRLVCKVWMGTILLPTGCFFRIRGKKNMPDGNCIIVCNHNSLLDIAMTTPYLPRPNKTIAKKSLAYIPFFGWVYSLGAILIDRKNTQSRRKGYDDMRKVLLKGDLDMLIYPEGTRNRTKEPLRPFQDGAFKLSIDTDKPLVPIMIFNTRNILPANKTFYMWPHKIEVHILPQMSANGKTTGEFKKEVFEVMQQYYIDNAGRS